MERPVTGNTSSPSTRGRSPVSLSAEDRRIRALRSSRNSVDPRAPLAVLLEKERRPGGRLETTLTVFLAGSECPFTCAFCDLWRNTLEGLTPRGALPAQLARALSQPRSGELPSRIKLYNASNFFDPRAVPSEDLDSLAALLEPFASVTVESHPRLVGPRCREFARTIAGRLEVAMGLETIHPDALPRLNKKMDLSDFDGAARFLHDLGIELRTFVLLGAPFVPPHESVAWAVRSVAHALAAGSSLVAIIPARGGNGEMERLTNAGEFTRPTLGDLEAALEQSLSLGPGVVVADLWDVERLFECAPCSAARIARLARMNASGRAEPPVDCGDCVPA